ncbi:MULTISPECIES: lytic transglycosylase domain-containing protein [Paenibacillus]|uniref:lytic transglycosylase domain-containing protein n=1 Tax=Paenibacillus TaxID=44249 RepID=UPI0022B931D1|nr:lytic transglycosylase domain-containing protein [Paenibacillus caseinilyticus]MCZ8518739.1 lytic transglycosylase domain-containing protein [Paenibacillus caseinilyticus]
MSINSVSAMDPRTIKELLQLQMLTKSSLLSGGTGAASGDDGDFSELLSQLVAMQENASGAAADKPAPSIKPALLTPAGVASAHAATGAGEASTASKATKPTSFDSLIEEAGSKYGVDTSLIKGVIQAESSFNPNAQSGAGAKGLMQLMDATGQGLGVRDPFDPEQNIQGGTKYLANLLEQYDGNTGMALAAYNGGPARLKRLGIQNDQQLMEKIHLFPKETQGYVNKVLQFKEGFEV